MKQVAIGRNWPFIGSVAVGERIADLLTLVSSAVRNQLDVCVPSYGLPLVKAAAGPGRFNRSW
jgi:hypothetical protein